MGIAAIKALSLKNKLHVLKYSIGSRLINSVPKGVKQSYEFLRWLEGQSISFKKQEGSIQFNYPIGDKAYSFAIDENSSDSDVFKQIILEGEYDYLKHLIVGHGIEVNTIVDGGANVGYTSIYLSHFFNTACIIALEPNSGTFARLTRNLELNQLKNIVCWQKGLWNKNTYLKADHTFRDQQAWSFRLEETENESEKLFEAVSIEHILSSTNWATIDLLKIDIEGGEKEVFKPDTDIDWLNQVKVIAIEIHDEFDCRGHIEQVLKDCHFELLHSGELTIGVNKVLTGIETVAK
jgi:FkbM family methyltransferase